MSFRQRRRYCVFGCTDLGISSSPAILVQLEHNYCIQGVQTSDPPLQFKDTVGVEI
ncbi:hypothetical protein RR46_14990 [Papilio xuthus]|uniref:Uncharacterized protein n=1 Tax=Papilio xuthus TaxID=66420 RepID=A0A194PDR0_PAPXU|nr:hypothetical protein RR46_14990 [Papilio xuthus]